jgi:hypothetical protein
MPFPYISVVQVQLRALLVRGNINASRWGLGEEF